MPSSRNRFSRGAGALKTVMLSDPFSTMIANMNKNLTYLNQQKALAALAAGDPDTFLRLSPNIAKNLTGQELDDWNHIVQKAQDKIEETKWATFVEEDPNNLEAFVQHLQDKLSSASAGTQEYYDLVHGLDLAKKGIKARDENAADQQALAEYIQTEDHAAYISYLTKKLQSTTDPVVFQKIGAQIQTLKERQATQEQVGRIRARADAMSQYLDGKVSAAKTIQKLQELSNDAKITPAEVANLQTLVTQIHDREESAARRGASQTSASLGADIPALNKNIAQYNRDANELDARLKAGEVPNKLDPNDPITRLQLALDADTQVLTGQYSSMADVAAQLGERATVQSLNTTIDGLDTFYKGIPNRVDTNIYDKGVKQTKKDFDESVAKMVASGDFFGAAEARVRRSTDLSGVIPVLTTQGKKGAVAQELRDMATDNRDAITTLSKDTGMTGQEKDKLDLLYKEYSSSPNVTQPVSENRFIVAIRDAAASDDPAHTFAKATNYQIKTNNLAGMFVNEDQNAVELLNKYVEDAQKLAESSKMPENQQKSEDLLKLLLSTPGGMPFGNPGTPEYQIMGLTEQDVMEMRRGMGLIKGGYNPALTGQTPDSTYIQPQINGPLTGGFGFGGGNKSPSLVSDSEADLTSYPDSTSESLQELRLQRQAEREAMESQQPSIEDTLLASTPMPMPEMPAFDPMAGGDLYGQMQMPQMPEPDYSLLDPAWQEALKYLDQGVNIDVPGFEMPSIPDSTPYNIPGLTGDNGAGPALDAGNTDYSAPDTSSPGFRNY